MSLDSGFDLGSQSPFDRFAPVDTLDVHLPDDAIRIELESGGVWALRCPVTGIFMNKAMAIAVDISEEDLGHMLERRCPLGISNPQTWDSIVDALRTAFAEVGASLEHSRGGSLDEFPVSIAVGGSAVGGFSSFATAMGKKRFPANLMELETQIRSSSYNKGLPIDHLKQKLERGREVYQQLGLEPGKIPVAPWFRIMEKLGIEGPADVDIQIHSDLIDREMTLRAVDDPGILRRRDDDRLKRWVDSDVYEAFPPLYRLLKELQDTQKPVDLEFLGPGGSQQIANRSDWWRVSMHGPKGARP